MDLDLVFELLICNIIFETEGKLQIYIWRNDKKLSGKIVFFQRYVKYFILYRILNKLTWGQFHQLFMSSFFKWKSFEQLFCTYLLGLYFLAKGNGAKAAQKKLVKLTLGNSFRLNILILINLMRTGHLVADKGWLCFNWCTVKPVYNDHPQDPNFVAVVDRWSLFRGNFMLWQVKMEPLDSGHCWQLVVFWRWSLAQVWLYY